MTCADCKWLDAPAEDITKAGRVHARYASTVYHCRVPFEPAPAPACMPTLRTPRAMMCPSYGAGCPLHERRAPR